MHSGFYTMFKRVTVVRKIILLTSNLDVILFYEIISINRKCPVFVKPIQMRNICTVKHFVDNSSDIKRIFHLDGMTLDGNATLSLQYLYAL